MPIRIAIPMPHSIDRAYSERAIPQYELAIEQAGGEAVRIPLDWPLDELKKLVETCDAVLLPGSNADVDPVKFKAARSPHTATADQRRDEVDDFLLGDVYAQRKPVLGICYGLQSLNVYRGGTLVQHIPDFLPEELRVKVDHEAGKKVAVAHAVAIEVGSLLAGIVTGGNGDQAGSVYTGTSGAKAPVLKSPLIAAPKALRYPKADAHQSEIPSAERRAGIELPVNSSHHQSADAIGDGLRIVARCTADGIIEALEGTAPDHFVVAVQWHPERSVELDEASRAIFAALIAAAEAWRTSI
jgi:putative glutamine amidotransferase